MTVFTKVTLTLVLYIKQIVLFPTNACGKQSCLGAIQRFQHLKNHTKEYDGEGVRAHVQLKFERKMLKRGTLCIDLQCRVK